MKFYTTVKFRVENVCRSWLAYV